MVNIIMIGIGIVIVVLAGYWGCVLFIQKCFQKSRTEAETLVNEKLEALIRFFSSQPTTGMTYDVAIGANGIAFREDVLNDSFHGLYDIWSDWYFEKCSYSPSGNMLGYEFRVYNPVHSISRKLTLQRVRQVAEKALTLHFHEQGIFNIPADNFIAVTTKGDRLIVIIACNEAGLNEIQQIRQRVH